MRIGGNPSPAPACSSIAGAITNDYLLQLLRSVVGRFCCKSLFALVIKNFPGFRRYFRVKMWGTSSPDDKLADDLGNAIESTRISGRRSDFLQQEN
jgi:hypothetical protein